jgi:hypothetical protein
METTNLKLKEHRKDVVKTIIDKIEVLSTDCIRIIFKGYTEIERTYQVNNGKAAMAWLIFSVLPAKMYKIGFFA